MLLPRFKFGPITGVEQVSFSLSRGVKPSLCSVTMPVAPNFRGPFTMSFSDGVRSVHFPDSIISDVSVPPSSDGSQSAQITILDRRWRWEFYRVDGHYNIQRGGQLVPGTIRSARALVTILLREMGERYFDVRAVPNDVYPHVDWDVDFAAAKLDELCQLFGLHVVLRHDNRIAIVRDGVGRDLPNLRSRTIGAAHDYGITPNFVGAISAPVRWQIDFPLEPVGLDKDGVIRPVKDLEIRPRNKKWTDFNPYTLDGMGRKYQKLAQQTVFKWYRMVLPEGFTRMPLTTLRVHSIKQLLPTLNSQVHQEGVDLESTVQEILSNDGPRRKQPQVFGQFATEDGANALNVKKLNTKKDRNFRGHDLEANPELVLDKSFSIDNERGIVKFGDPICRFINGDRLFPLLFLRVAVNFRHPVTHSPFRFNRNRRIIAGGNLTDWEVHEDVIPEIVRGKKETIPQSNPPEPAKKNRQKRDVTFKHNFAYVASQLDYYLQFAAAKHRPKQPASGRYEQVIPFSPDGMIAQVVFEIDSEGYISTTVHRELEGLQTVVSYEERQKQIAQLAAVRQQMRRRRVQNKRKDQD